MKTNLKDLTQEELEKAATDIGGKPYRARQIWKWLYEKNSVDIEEMTDLPKEFRQKLTEAGYTAEGIKTLERKVSRDETVKYLFELHDGLSIETVFIPEEPRGTVCISTQVGCKLSCRFCATGRQGFARNLSVGEILNQIIAIRRDIKNGRITNLVFMGMGEPMDNFEELNKALKVITAQKGFGYGARRVTVSTAGIIPGIEKLGKEWPGINLAVSLHSANDGVRDKLMPINKKYPLKKLAKALKEYPLHKTRKIMLEIILLDGVNDSDEAAKELLDFIGSMEVKINLIRFNPVKEIPYKPSATKSEDRFLAILKKAGVSATFRRGRGGDIEAACGQLRSLRLDRNS